MLLDRRDQFTMLAILAPHAIATIACNGAISHSHGDRNRIPSTRNTTNSIALKMVAKIWPLSSSASGGRKERENVDHSNPPRSRNYSPQPEPLTAIPCRNGRPQRKMPASAAAVKC